MDCCLFNKLTVIRHTSHIETVLSGYSCTTPAPRSATASTVFSNFSPRTRRKFAHLCGTWRVWGRLGGAAAGTLGGLKAAGPTWCDRAAPSNRRISEIRLIYLWVTQSISVTRNVNSSNLKNISNKSGVMNLRFFRIGVSRRNSSTWINESRFSGGLFLILSGRSFQVFSRRRSAIGGSRVLCRERQDKAPSHWLDGMLYLCHDWNLQLVSIYSCILYIQIVIRSIVAVIVYLQMFVAV